MCTSYIQYAALSPFLWPHMHLSPAQNNISPHLDTSIQRLSLFLSQTNKRVKIDTHTRSTAISPLSPRPTHERFSLSSSSYDDLLLLLQSAYVKQLPISPSTSLSLSLSTPSLEASSFVVHAGRPMSTIPQGRLLRRSCRFLLSPSANGIGPTQRPSATLAGGDGRRSFQSRAKPASAPRKAGERDGESTWRRRRRSPLLLLLLTPPHAPRYRGADSVIRPHSQRQSVSQPVFVTKHPWDICNQFSSLLVTLLYYAFVFRFH